ncbi:uncharacterized protein Z518_11080 [Rhinocladiella mackenziei CBS 650.93]|uniref:Rhinocladiella mackenziei CBS 650.93 unplaced genomic scaffold supercont1.11, whole genome shotgun sequence n=1 Tax=Rhinocladiella mackenziei CBS 650.93 TaxID=1442369 RepID=A0A0D2GMS9_9EURO|nr:uncharacterized protein Z518_11080 [Rhinocladiella mackenziei CBS 650.93]KIW99667.1 hypothetical protein Z518_11080 [Rhinocladiella mackenziei CBS 650.93]
MATRPTQAEPFPSYRSEVEDVPYERPRDESSNNSSRRASITSRLSKSTTRTRARTSSLIQSFVESNPPLGMWQATGEVGSKIPTLPEIRNGAFADEGWTHEGQMEHRGANPHEIHRRRVARTSSTSTRTRKGSLSVGTGATPTIAEERHEYFPQRASISVQEPLFEEEAYTQSRDQTDEIQQVHGIPEKVADTSTASTQREPSGPQTVPVQIGPDETGTYPNGYRFPKKHTWTQSTMIGLRAFWKFFLTPFGFLVTIYGLNVVGWGAMIFFVLLKAAPAMCHPNCEDDSSARQKWIEIDSQILNGLFCVTAFGLLPWRARDFFYLMCWRIGRSERSHRRLAGIYRGWYRLPGSDKLAEDIGPPPVYNKKNPRTPESPPPYTDEEIAKLEENPAIPIPATSMPEPPLTGIRARPSKPWTIDFVVWMYILNTAFQVCLCVWMWNWNRFNRPEWGTGLFITLGCLVAIFAGVLVFVEGSKVKKIEGIPIQEYDVLESVEDYQERKAKEDKKGAKKQARHEHHHHFRHGGSHKVVRSEKLKGHQWFTRH